jgi:basic membrane lipoprotein Med (substrate-binding protein (PBP1-ABC) superfamily)
MRLLIVLLFSGSVSVAQPTDLDFYGAFLSNDRAEMQAMEKELKGLQQTAEIRAKRGALQAKIAMSEKDKSDKVRYFNMGKEMLEKQCRENKGNNEFRFLRLCVQTFCNDPNYNQHVQEDRDAIVAKFYAFNTDLKNIIKSYAKTSSVFKDVVLE